MRLKACCSSGLGEMIGRAGGIGNPGFPVAVSDSFFSKNGVAKNDANSRLSRRICRHGFFQPHFSPHQQFKLKPNVMSDTRPGSASGPDFRPEELPPVTPPSAGFIVQLFVIPALIVMAVVAVWALFGKLADSGSDWQQLVAELGGGNEHRRWRAAQELAQLLHNERIAPPADRAPLASNPQVALALSELLKETLASPSTSPETIMQQEFLARALGGLEADDTTLPILAQTLSSDRAPDVRKSGLMAITAISGRHFDKAMGYDPELAANAPPAPRNPLETATISNSEVLQQIRVAAQDQDAIVRHIAAYALGNISGPESISQLKVMLGDSDRQARANAAMGLARNGDAAALPVLLELLQSLTMPAADPPAASTNADQASSTEAANRRAELPVLARNCLRAVRDLWTKLTPEEQQRTTAAVQSIADTDSLMADIRVQARNLLEAVTAASASANAPAERNSAP